jgi:leucyl aminopeptidase (aminopeptidase T)
MKRLLPIVYLIVVIFSCQPSKESTTVQGDTTETGSEEKIEHLENSDDSFQYAWEKIADEIMNRADLQAGEKVLLVGYPGEFDSLVMLLEKKIEQRDAEYLGTFSVTYEQPEAWETDFVEDAAEKERDQLAQQFESVDLGIMLPGADTTHLPYAAMQEVLRQGKGRTIHFHWAGAYSLKGALIPNSTQIDETYQAALLNTDYKKLLQVQTRFEKAMRTNTIHITTPLGTDISFSIGNRPVTRQDGDASQKRSKQARNFIDREIELPAGAVRVAPLEESVEGTIAFPDTNWKGTSVRGLKLKFEKGKIVDIQAKDGLESVQEELAAAGASAAFRELAVGFNPLLAVPDVGRQWIPHYGYGAGVIRLSLGDNSELGGNVGGGYVRWNFFIDATLTLGKTVWIRDGKMVDPNSR